MHILLGILGFIGGLAMLLWRIKLAADAAKSIAGTAVDAKNYMRRRRSEKQAGADPIEDIDDPREAAATMMAALACYDGAISERQENIILDEIQNHFNADKSIATELLAHGRWLAKDVGDLNSFFARLLPSITRHCAPKEKRDLISMLENVASADGEASNLEKDAILFVRRHLDI